MSGMAQTTVTTNSPSGGNWTAASPVTWTCNPALLPCIPNNSSVDVFDVGINGGAVLLNSSSTLTAVTVDSLSISAGANLQIYDAHTLNVTGNVANNGPIYVDSGGSGGSSLAVGGNLTNAGGMQIGSGYLNTASASTVTVNGALKNTGGVVLYGGGTAGADALLDVKGTFSNTGGVALYGNSSVSGATGQLVAANLTNGGTINNNGGVINIGTMAGTDPGSFTMGSDATLTELIGGTNTGEFGVMDLSGTVTLDGILNISTLSDFNFSAGESFDFLNFPSGNLVGNFGTLQYGSFSGDGLSLLDIGNGLALDMDYDSSGGAVVLNVLSFTPPSSVPEPSSLLLLGMGLLGLVCVVRAKRMTIA